MCVFLALTYLLSILAFYDSLCPCLIVHVYTGISDYGLSCWQNVNVFAYRRDAGLLFLVFTFGFLGSVMLCLVVSFLYEEGRHSISS